MAGRLIPRRVCLILLAAAVMLPISVLVIWGLASLLGAMGDAAGGRVLERVAQAGGILWALDLIFLVLAHAANGLAEEHEPSEEPPAGP